MKRYTKFGLPVLLLTLLAIVLVSCTEADTGDTQEANHDPKGKSGGMAGMKGMDHGSGGMASGMMTKNGKYSDERFIDAMVPHHEGAVDMAQVALKNAEHPEIEQLAKNIITTQRAEIEKLKFIKKQEFGNSRVPTRMGMDQMKSMGMMTDPHPLAHKNPFDKAFIESMIPHHQSPSIRATSRR